MTEKALHFNEPKRIKDEEDAAKKAAKAAAKAPPKTEEPAAAPAADAPKTKTVTKTIKLGDPATDVEQWEECKHGFKVPPRMTPRLEGMELEKTITEEVVDDSAPAPAAEPEAPAAPAPEPDAPAKDPASDPDQWEESKYGFKVPPPMTPKYKGGDE
ncbi:MAG: hypothetical protein ACYS0E_23340 [Planctomycetota bacterium]|jgi:hypothetical protein